VATATSAADRIGVSARSDWYALYSNNPSYPDDRETHRGGLDSRLVALMDQAQRTLDVADYDFDLESVTEAMVRAKQRGVRVRMVTDSDTVANTKHKYIQEAFGKLKAVGIPIVEDNRAAIMHHKFAVVDGARVSTGSWNYTDGDTYRLNNWMGIFESPALAANYSAEFAQMFEQRKFGPAKARQTANPTLTVDSARVQNCFSPQDGCADLIVDTIEREAKQSIQFMAFSFTHDGIGEAIMERAKAGVKVEGVFETTGSSTPFSEYGRMKKAGLAVYTDGNPYAMHHKVIILDGRISIAGSFNFSNNADKDNDENLLIVEDRGFAQFFEAEFDRVLRQAQNPPKR
jgi:phosphatidylserine/phosphatidylglycerophosphate/cardiolipin synthase-like enzyme